MSTYTNTIRTPRVINNDRGNYWRYYGLQRDPFALTAEDTGFYLPPRWEQYFDLLHYLCDSTNVLLMVTGIRGSGKTTFLRQFITEVNESKQVCQLTALPTLNTTQLKAALIKNFSLPHPVGETLEEQLDNLVIDLQAKSQPCLLIIDDAHRLPEETLRTLLHLIKQQSENQMRLHVLLSGDPRLKNVLGFLAEREGDRELVHTLMLDPFTLEETKSYLKHRLMAVGLPSAMPFSQSALTRIYSLSEGVASRINAVARQTLIDSMQQRPLFTLNNFIQEKHIQFLGGTILFIALAVLAFIVTRHHHYSLAQLPETWFKKENTISSHASMPKSTLASVQIETIKSDAWPYLSLENAHKNYINLTQLLENRFLKHRFHQTSPVKQSETTVVTVKIPNASSVISVESAIQLPVRDQMNFAAESMPIIHADLQSAAVSSGTKAIAKTVSAAMPQITKSKIQFAALTPAIPNAPLVSTPIVSNNHAYTVQLVAMPDENAIKKFIAANQLTGKVNLMRLTKQGKDWYVALYGEYPTSAAARAAVYDLPSVLQKQKPWVRSFASIQKSLLNNTVDSNKQLSIAKQVTVAKKDSKKPLQAAMVTTKVTDESQNSAIE